VELAALPPDAPLGDALVCHAGPGDDMRSVPPDPSEDDGELLAGVTARRLIVGHTHVAFARTVDGVQLVNPGSVGMPLDGDPRAAYALLHDNGRIEHLRVDYDVDAAIDRALEFAGGAAWGEEIARRLRTAGAG
jgi:diadenosine tetraphosphatase ApaH/serine/threonine PP2A family protein phosphatase